MRRSRTASGLVAGALVLPILAAPVDAQAPSLSMLDQMAKGLWEVRVRGGEEPTRRVCLGNPRSLIQLRHHDLACARVVVNDKPGEVTVQYTCKGKGYGRTHIRLENPSLAQIDSQGIDGGLPFAFAAEARRIGPCAG
ncbi:hypothetical protein B2G71_00390 [Novosphingobium sp. PC22D]|uniref:DUF3617 domain-containing protein n=1 Tax=Novosphingobium sp. PC22D TaxID=1962403 RepID=UPI000BFB0814|nr:hypothetical protein [Novosphingobium sp. PC22D]PEQ14118.1 hypothetical protein B2G71_00390 [Novosphingobium sp. PC22D]